MLILLAALSAHAATIEVYSGDSIASAVSSAGSGDEVVVHAGADASGQIMLTGKTLTIRSATSARVDIPAMRLSSGSEVTLERVNIATTDVGSGLYYAIRSYDSTIRGEDVRLEDPYTGIAILLSGGTLDVDGLQASSFGGRVVYGQTSGMIDPTISLRGCSFDDNATGVISIPGGSVSLEDCEIEGNSSSSAPVIYSSGAASVVIKSSRLVDNVGITNSSSAILLGSGSTLVVRHSTVCGNQPDTPLWIDGEAEVTLYRNILDGTAASGGVGLLRLGASDLHSTHNTWIGKADQQALTIDGQVYTWLVNDIYKTLDLFEKTGSWGLYDAGSSHNLFDGTGGIASLLPAMDTDYLQADPDFVSEWSAGDCWVRPMPNHDSPAVDSGDPAAEDDGVVPDEGPPDRGAVPWSDPTIDTGDTDTDTDTDTDPVETGHPDTAQPETGDPDTEPETQLSTYILGGGGGCRSAGGVALGLSWLVLLGVAARRRR